MGQKRISKSVLLLSLIVMVPIGYWVRFLAPGPEWLSDALGSIAYEIFWVLLFVLLLPKSSPLWIAVGVFLATCGIEVLQLWRSPLLEAARATLPGRLVLGNSFTWSDFPTYAIGSFLGWVWVRSLAQK
jgi:Protein of unknown function (DUF2809)